MDRAVIITGAASGIGAATARLLATRIGGPLFLVDRDKAALDTLAGELARTCPVETCAGDLADPDFCEAVPARCADRFDAIAGFVSNAGLIRGAPLTELTLADYERLFAVNTRPAWLIARAAHPYLRRGGGSIVATASISADHPTPPLGSYAASKAALVMLVRQMALEWGPDGIRANCVSPGPTFTPMAAGYADPELRAGREATIPLRKIGSAGDVARTIAFLLGPDAGHISGQNIAVDGGLCTALMALSGSGQDQPRGA